MPKKLILDIDNENWKEVKKFKIDRDLKTNNDAVVALIENALKNINKK